MSENDHFAGHAARIAFRVAAYYGLFGVIWIIGTDLLLTSLHLSPGQMQRVQSFKGILFVLLSLTVVFLSVWREGKKVERASQDLSQEKKRLSSIIEGSNAGTWEWDIRSGEITINKHLANILGYQKEELEPLKPRTFMNSIHPDDFDESKEILKQHLKDNRDFYSDEIRLQHSEDKWVWVRIIGKVTRWSENDQPLIMSGSVFSITERKAAQEELRRSKKRFQELAELLPQPVWETDTEGNIIYSNHAGLEKFGYSQQDLKEGIRIEEVFAREERERASQSFQKVLKGENVGNNEYRALRADGEEITVLVYSSPISKDGQRVGLRGITLDISEQKRARRRLENQKQEMAILLKNLPGMAYKCENDRDWTMRFVSKGCKDLTGYNPEEIVDNSHVSYGDLIVKEDQRTVWEEVQDSLTAREPFELEYRIRTKDGKLKWVWERGRGLYDSDGSLENIQGFISDITERRNMESELRKSEERFRSYVENAPVGVFVIDQEGQYVEVNEAACQMTGYPRKELLTMKMPDLHPPNAASEARTALEKLLDKGRMEAELPYERNDETEGYMVINAVRLSEARYLGFTMDVTGRKEAERQLQQATFETLQALNRTIEAKDRYTGEHIDRVQEYSEKVGRKVGLSESRLEQLEYASILHDIGKIGVSDSVLGKSEELSEEEWVEMKKHPKIGEKIVEQVDRLERAARIIGQHQEHYDGSGYPRGLKGEKITLEARIIAVVDAWDAMRTDRPYREALPREEAIKELKENAGTQFDPDIVALFLDMIRAGGTDIR